MKTKIAIIFLSILSPVLTAQTFTLKYATLAPEGSTWGRYVRQMQKDMETKTQGRVKLRVFYGGVAGDEKTMMDKLKRSLIDMASFTGIELGATVPEVRLLELPFFFENHAQVDAVVAALYPDFEAKFKEKGLIVAGWGESGFVYLMSKKPIRSAADMQGVKIWAPKGDELVRTMLTEYGLVPVYLGFESVLPQLQTGGLDAVYAPPMGAIGLQWFRSLKYYSNAKLANGTGATLISEKSFKQLPPDLQKIVKEVSEENSRALIQALRAENMSGFLTLQKNGLEAVDVSPEELKKLRDTAMKVQNKLVGRLYSQELLDKARRARDKAR